MVKILSIQQTCSYLKEGHLIAYPTESVYALGCDALNLQAVTKIKKIKERELNKGLIVLVANLNQAEKLICPKHINSLQKAAKTWPGPTTWVFPAGNNTPDHLQFNKKIAIRISPHKIAAELCNNYPHPIISTSLNLQGQPPAITLQEASTFKEFISGITQGTPGRNPPSTIIDSESLEILRK